MDGQDYQLAQLYEPLGRIDLTLHRVETWDASWPFATFMLCSMAVTARLTDDTATTVSPGQSAYAVRVTLLTKEC